MKVSRRPGQGRARRRGPRGQAHRAAAARGRVAGPRPQPGRPWMTPGPGWRRSATGDRMCRSGRRRQNPSRRKPVDRRTARTAGGSSRFSRCSTAHSGGGGASRSAAFSTMRRMTEGEGDDRLYFRQLLAGLDIAGDDPVAQQMVNFVYLIGDRETREAVVVDPAYDVAGILDIARRRRHAPRRGAGHPLPPRPRRRASCSASRSRASASCSPSSRCRSTSRPTRPGGCVRSPTSTASDLVEHRSGDVVAGGRHRHRAHPHARPHTGQPVLLRGQPAGGRRHVVPRRAAAAPTSPAAIRPRCTKASPPSWPGSPTTPCCSPAISTPGSRRRRWATPAGTTPCSDRRASTSGSPDSGRDRRPGRRPNGNPHLPERQAFDPSARAMEPTRLPGSCEGPGDWRRSDAAAPTGGLSS